MSGPRRFGTDGIRAPFGTAPLDRPTVVALGHELGAMLVERHGSRPLVILGGDTRASTPTLAAWLAAGLEDAGAEPLWLGVVPTGGLAFLVRHLGAAGAAVVSASHNPYPDNGIKLIDENGFKWSPAAEAEIEGRIEARLATKRAATGGRPYGVGAQLEQPATGGRPSGEGGESASLGSPSPSSATAIVAYLDSLAASVPGEAPLAGLDVALDVGHGAAFALAGPLFERMGARVTVMNAAPDGTNINAGCGSTDPRELRAALVAGKFHLGFAFDGDADRAILVDELGEERDGDAILYLWARDLAQAGRLEPKAIVATSMSNLGLERALAREGIAVHRSDVGDREVVRRLLDEKLQLGGEQSGHIVHLGLSTTGDGLLTALQVAAVVARAREPLSRLLSGFVRFPQILENVRVTAKPPLESVPEVAAAVALAQAKLGDEGRLVLRYSGTEPLARVMIEGPDAVVITKLAGAIAAAIRTKLGAPSGDPS